MKRKCCYGERGYVYVSPHIGSGPVLELGPIFRPMLELWRGRPQIVTVPV